MNHTLRSLSLAPALVLGAFGLIAAGCDGNPAVGGPAGLAPSGPSASGGGASTVAVVDAAPMNGAVAFGDVTHADGSALSDVELAAAIAEFPALGVNYDQLRAATQADVASGIVTLWDASGNVILTIPVAGVGTIRSVTVTEGAAAEQGKCMGSNLIFALHDSEQPAADQEQEQGQEKGKSEPKELRDAGFNVRLVLACEEAKPTQEPKQEAPVQEAPKQEAPKQEAPKQGGQQ